MKNIFIKSTIILILGGFFTKVLGLITKIVLTRLIGTTGIGLYSMILPTYILLVNISQFGLPQSLNILIPSEKYNNKNLIITCLLISLLLDLIIAFILILFNNFIAINLLNNNLLSLGLLCISFVLPFISLSNILRSYFFSKQRVLPHTITNILEDLIKLIILIILIPKYINQGLNVAISIIILSNILCELSTIIIFYILLPKFTITKIDIKINIKNTKDILKISIPTTLSRLIGSIGYFFEPIILTSILLKLGYSNGYIVSEYGIINGYVMQLVLLPSFFTLAISQAITPIISKLYYSNKIKQLKAKFKEAIIFSLIIGIPATIILEIFPAQLLQLLFKTNKGINYIKIIAPICLLHYIQSPISATLQAINKAKDSMVGTLLGVIIRITSLIIFTYLFNIWGLIIATSINIIFVTTHNTLKLIKYLK